MQQFLRVVSLNGLAVFIKLATMLGLSKLLAILVGPAGFAAVGQFQNVVQISSMMASGAISTGVTKYAAEGSQDSREALLSSALWIVLVCSGVVGCVLIIFGSGISQLVFGSDQFAWLIRGLAIASCLAAINLIVLAYLNGRGSVRGYVVANIAGSIIALVLTAPSAFWFGLNGALFGLGFYQAFSVFASVWMARSLGLIDRRSLSTGFEWLWATKLAQFAIMAATSAICVPLSHIVIRDFLTGEFGVVYAGYWEAVWRVSGSYLMLATLTLSLYFVPRFSQVQSWVEAKTEIRIGYVTMLPAMALLAVLMHTYGELIVRLLLSDEFLPIANLLVWQAAGDVLKVGALIVAYLMLGKAMTRVYVVTEVFASVLFMVMVVWACDRFGFEGVIYAI